MTVLSRQFLIVDFEFTTHRNGPGRPRAFFPEIIEAGAVLLSPPGYEAGEPYQRYVRPRFFPRLTEECRNITLIQQKDIDAGITMEKMLEDLSKSYQTGRTYIVAWGNADRDVIANACVRYKIDCPFSWDDYIDLAEEYKVLYSLERLASLKSALIEREITQTGLSHLALDDALNTAQVLKKMLAEGWEPRQPAATAANVDSTAIS